LRVTFMLGCDRAPIRAISARNEPIGAGAFGLPMAACNCYSGYGWPDSKGCERARSIAEAKDRLSTLVKEAEQGEDVAITRHGKVVAYLRPAEERPHRRPSHELIGRIVERAKSRPLGENSVDIIRRMRDGEWD
jgi:prevent-host-death family protein